MAKSTEFNLTLKATDKASRPVYEMYQKLKREGKALTNNERQRQMLGIRGERQIQAEILRTQRAYQQLARSGKASSNELARAKQAELKRVRELNTELGRSERLSGRQKLVRGMQVAGAVGAGLYAASSLVMNPINKRLDYDKSVRGLTKTAYAEADLDGLMKGEENIRDIIEHHVTKYGATIDQVVQALDGAFTKGFEVGDIESVLPSILKTSIASNSDPAEIAVLVKALMDNKFKAEDIDTMLNQMVMSGALGSFEMSDMAKVLPQILSSSMGKGFTVDQLPQILGALQVLTQTSGSTNSAVTQYEGLLNEINQPRFKQRMLETEVVNPKTGKKHGVAWTESLTKAAEENKSPVEAVISIIQDVLDSNPDLKKYKEGLTSEDVNIRQEAAMKIMESSVLGGLFTNDMARKAVLGLIQQKEMFRDQVTGVKESGSIVETQYQYEQQSNDAKAQSFADQVELKRLENAKALADTYGNLSEILLEYMKQYPELTEKLILFGDSLKVVMAALAMWGIANKVGGMMGGKGNPAGGGGKPPSPKNGTPKGGGKGIFGFSWMLPVSMALALEGDSGGETIQNALKDKNDKAQPFIDSYVDRYGQERADQVIAKHRGDGYGVGAIPAWQAEELLKRDDKKEQLRKWRESDRRPVPEQSDVPYKGYKREVDEDGNELDYQSPSTQFRDNMLAMGRELENINRGLVEDIARSMEALQNAVPKEIVVNMPVTLDGRQIYDNQERIFINQLNRGV